MPVNAMDIPISDDTKIKEGILTMKRLLCLILAVAVCLVPLSVSAAVTADVTLHKNTTVTCTVMENDSLNMLFVPDADGVYTFASSNNDGDPEAILYLIDGSDSVEIFRDGDSGDENNFKITAQLTGGAQYILQISDYWGEKVVCNVKVNNAEKDYLTLSSTVLTLDKAENVAVSNSALACFEFTPAADGLYNFYSQNSAEWDSYVYCYSVVDDTLVSGTFNDDGFLGTDFSLTQALKAGVTYVFKVGCYSQPATGIITYNVAITQNSQERVTLQTAEIAEGDNSYTAGENMTYFSFIPQETADYTFTTDFDAYLYLYENVIGSLVAVTNAEAPVSVVLKSGTEYIIGIDTMQTEGVLTVSRGALVTTTYIYDDANMYITGIPEDVTAAEFKKEFSGEIILTDASENIVADNNIVCTGFNVAVNGKSYTTVIKGDVTKDGQVNSTDFMRVRRHFLETYTIEGISYAAGDVNDDGRLNSVDFMRIRSHYLGRYDLYE